MNTQKTIRILSWTILILVFGITLHASQAENTNQNFFGTEPITRVSKDPNKPVPRGYLIPSVRAVPGGAEITVDLFHHKKNSKVKLNLQVAINDGKKPDPKIWNNSNVRVYNIQQLCDFTNDNPDNYYSRRVFTISYQELNKIIKHAAKNSNLTIGSGTPLFVHAQWDVSGNGGWTHEWGGVSRGGIIFMPEDPSNPGSKIDSDTAGTRRPLELDLAFPIMDTLALRYNDPITKKGLKRGGQIRSRMETEGKYQIPLDELASIKKALFALAENPAKAETVLGKGWTLEPQLRYMKKDKQGKLLKDKAGLPIPDPMVDTYYDNDKLDAAKHDMAIRYRWTEGNHTGSWNFKPGLTKTSKAGIVTRLEYGLDTTDARPESIAKFVDSTNPLNPFRLIRNVIPNSTPSSFFKPSVQVSDTRYKFLMKHSSGLIIELSLDDVRANSLRPGHGAKARFAQMEMDVDHLSTQSNNVATSAHGYDGLPITDKEARKAVAKLDTGAFFDGRPVLHTEADLDFQSPLRTSHYKEFYLASRAITAIRNEVIGNKFLPGAQKYAIAASALGMLGKKESSPSVRKVTRKTEKENKNSANNGSKGITIFQAMGIAGCGFIFN